MKRFAQICCIALVLAVPLCLAAQSRAVELSLRFRAESRLERQLRALRLERALDRERDRQSLRDLRRLRASELRRERQRLESRRLERLLLELEGDDYGCSNN